MFAPWPLVVIAQYNNFSRISINQNEINDMWEEREFIELHHGVKNSGLSTAVFALIIFVRKVKDFYMSADFYLHSCTLLFFLHNVILCKLF